MTVEQYEESEVEEESVAKIWRKAFEALTSTEVSKNRYWVSWYQVSKDPLKSIPKKDVLWWYLEASDNGAILCALVEGYDENDAKQIVIAAWPELDHWLFVERKPNDWLPDIVFDYFREIGNLFLRNVSEVTKFLSEFSPFEEIVFLYDKDGNETAKNQIVQRDYE